MALKSVIDIDVRDQSFRDFAERWRKYQDQLVKAPGQWQQQAVQIKGAKRAWDALTTQVFILKELQGTIVKSQRDETRVIEHKVQLWDRLVRASRAFQGNVESAAGNLLRIVKPTALISGLLGAGSLFGLERLGANAANYRRSSLGLGVSAGEQRAFELNFQRLVDAPGFLGGVAEALRGPNRFALYGLGLSEQELQGKSAAQVGALGIQRLKGRVDRTPENQLDFLAGSLGLDKLGLTGEDLMRLRRTPAAEVVGVGAQFGKDTRGLGSIDATLRAWQEFTIQMDRAGQKIETALINNLVKLAPELTKLSDDVVKALTDPALTGQIKQFASDLADMVANFRGFLSWVRYVANIQVPSPQAVGQRAGEATLGFLTDIARSFETQGLGIKSGAGITPGQMPLVRALRANVKGLGLFTAGQDLFHRGWLSPHNEERALDAAPGNRNATHDEVVAVAAQLKTTAEAMGYTGVHIKPEGLPGFPLSRHGTAPHYHIEWTGRIQLDNRTGASVNASALQAAGGSTK